jgi:hypothetical protein
VYSFPHGAFSFLAESFDEVLADTFAAMMDAVSSFSESLDMLLMFASCVHKNGDFHSSALRVLPLAAAIKILLLSSPLQVPLHIYQSIGFISGRDKVRGPYLSCFHYSCVPCSVQMTKHCLYEPSVFFGQALLVFDHGSNRILVWNNLSGFIRHQQLYII